MARILGFTTKRPGVYSDLGFVAVTRGKGQGRGWRVREGLRVLGDVLRVGGTPAVDQLRRFAQFAFRRMWTHGLLTRDDIAEVMSIESVPVERRVLPRVIEVPFSGPVPRVAATSTTPKPLAKVTEVPFEP